LGPIPCWRAISETDIPGAYVSCTIRAFSSADQGAADATSDHLNPIDLPSH
jgi:hypothetical protein